MAAIGHTNWQIDYVQAGRPACGLAEETRQQRNQGDAHQRNAAASHQLLHALRLYLCVIKKQ